MKNLLRISLVILLLSLSAANMLAQIQVQAPRQVQTGEQFRLQYKVNTADIKDFRGGNVPSEGFEVLMGPSTSRQQSFSVINGQVSQSSSVTYTYILYAHKAGTYTISPAHATIDGKKVESAAVKIIVSGAQAPTHQGNGAMSGRGQQQQNPQQGAPIRGNELYITATANKTHVHEQEPILLTYKVYTQVELTQLAGKMPDLNGFHTQEIQLPQQKSFHIETVNGKTYKCVTWSQYVMFPQMTGKLEIPSITFDGLVVQMNQNIDPFEALFNGGSSYTEVKRSIKAPAITIQVDPLPAKPAKFSGGVGKFSISASLDKPTVKAGDPVNVRIVVDGTGNLKLVKQPEIVVPKDFDKYDAKITEKTHLTTSGLTGNMIYDVLIVPRNQGKYEIPPIQLVYFDTQSSSYKTVSTQPLQLTVEQGSGKSADVADYSQRLDNDIHPIHDGKSDIKTADDVFFGKTTYIILNTVVFLLFLVLLIIFRKRAMERANVAGMRGKKANSVASKRLNKAAKYMAKGQGNQFYDEVLRALWGYVADKFAMPVADLSRDNISEQLSEKSVEKSVIDSFLEAIDECEFERYAPGDATGNMQKTYDKAVTAITKIEDVMKHVKKSKRTNKVSDSYLKTIVTILFAVGLAFTAYSPACAKETKAKINEKEVADSAYSRGNYQEAISIYNKILKTGRSADIYYNLGNAYYRSDNLTQAIIAYERASLLAPGDKDIKHNLQIARSKTIDQMQQSERIVFVEWYDSFCNMFDMDSWAYIALFSLIFSLILFLVYLFVSQPVVQRLSFYSSLILIIVFVLGNVFAWQLSNKADNHDGAVVTAPAVTVKKTPSSQSGDACIIHEGTRINVTDKSIKGWTGIKLLDGREGWIPSSTIETI